MRQAPTDAQLRVLANLVAGRDMACHCRTRSDYGGLVSTLRSLKRRGWINYDGEITDSGRRVASGALAAPKQKARDGADDRVHDARNDGLVRPAPLT